MKGQGCSSSLLGVQSLILVSIRVLWAKYHYIAMMISFRIPREEIYIKICICQWFNMALLGVKKSFGHTQVSLLQGFNSKFPKSIPPFHIRVLLSPGITHWLTTVNYEGEVVGICSFFSGLLGASLNKKSPKSQMMTFNLFCNACQKQSNAMCSARPTTGITITSFSFTLFTGVCDKCMTVSREGNLY